MALNRKASPELQALLDQQAEMARQIKEAEKEQAAREAAAAKVAAKNGAAYAGLVLDLYDVLDVEPEHPRTRNSKTGPVEIPTDPGEELRLSRLSEMLEHIIGAADQGFIDALKAADRQGRDQRRDEREAAREAAATARKSVPKNAISPDGDGADLEDDPDASASEALANEAASAARAWAPSEPVLVSNGWG